MLRPTKSLSLWIQQSGRALRPFPGKEYAIILDHAGNTAYHGLPHDEHEWSLTGRIKRKGAPPIKECGNCCAAVPIVTKVCPYCGFEFEVESTKMNHVEGDLVEVDLNKRKISYKQKRKVIKNAHTFQELVVVGKRFGYKVGFPYMILKLRREGKIDY